MSVEEMKAEIEATLIGNGNASDRCVAVVFLHGSLVGEVKQAKNFGCFPGVSV